MKLGKKTLKKVNLKKGKATVKLTKQKRGTRKYTIIYSGTSKVAPQTIIKKTKIK